MSNQGILPIQDLRDAITKGIIASPGDPIPRANLQPASLDLRLGGIAHRLRCSFLPQGRSVSDRLEEIAMDSMYLDQGGTVLEVNRPYLIPLTETLNLPPDIRARANPRSSTGRLDIFTRVITDNGNRFDDIAAGYQGPMYLEIVSRSYTIRVHRGQSLNQVRLIRGNPRLSGAEILDSHRSDPLALRDGKPCRFQPENLDHGLPLSVDLVGKGDGIAGYRVRRNSRLLDLSLVGGHRTEDFWEPVRAEDGLKLILEPEEFYLLASLETVRIPPNLAAEMVALDPESGEFRTHYAGFFDPGFGHDATGHPGGHGGAGPRRALHAGARAAGLPAGVRAPAADSRHPLRQGRGVQLPGAGATAEQALPGVDNGCYGLKQQSTLARTFDQKPSCR